MKEPGGEQIGYCQKKMKLHKLMGQLEMKIKIVGNKMDRK
jgi:hypothetical protein